uniref:Uncharacterized protein n=1 Tax=Nelumbo nucifera TaxID=4432 RepID=A0A822ZS73_NELNU|nr:TPA_asm: hypothetical protein HUJ06_017674 [Nelumbo nucifera]
MVANGERVQSNRKCRRVKVKSQGNTIIADVYLLNLPGYDAVLGIQWLKTLGPITLDCNNMILQYREGDYNRILKGLKQSSPQHVKASKSLCKPGQLFIVKFSSLSSEPSSVVDNHELTALLHEFDDVFKEPTGLPPPCPCDHAITLEDGTCPVCLRPYRYLYSQKNEIERLARELLTSGAIRPSNSPYTSPVLLVKK